ncbi:MAG: selenocysteine-specific translation elongation factor [Deltaproteobacteria bacterium]|nr:selenocysteine-specific translation elongation factor [Deltaproteobacteria bacterium]
MKRLILGTAGHVDHGKTALIKALTGFDCDTHKEEKARGITINLGFTHLELPSGASLGIVDVPGHRDFIHTMVSGAMGIDLCMLVVAADNGVMPQTREHLQIMDVLGIRAGLVALTKVDLVEPELAELAEGELRELLAGTFLDGCPLVRVSAVTREGLDALVETLDRVARTVPERPAGRVFRLFPDRVFSIAGFGTVVTGSVLGGELHREDTAWLLPPNRKLRVRRLERHGVEVDTVRAGDRASVNLVGLERSEFRRGMVVSDRPLAATTLLDARLRLFSDARPLGRWTQAVLHLGTHESQARVHLLDQATLAPGSTGLAQLHLGEPCVVQAGDRFVLRSTSSDLSLGGGEVLDPRPLHHRRRTAAVAAALAELSSGRFPQLLAAEVLKQRRPVDRARLAELLNVAEEDVAKVDTASLPDDIVALGDPPRTVYLPATMHERLEKGILAALETHHRDNPLSERGRTTEELLGPLGFERGGAGEAAVRLLLEALERNRRVKPVAHTWALFSHRVEMSADRRRQSTFVESFLAQQGMATPSTTELTAAAAQAGLKERDVQLALRYLVEQRRVYQVEGEYLAAKVVDGCQTTLLRELAGRKRGLTVAEFRDLVSGNRRICLLLFALFDREGLTRREGDTRVLTEKGRTEAARGATPD